jgi:RHS repeat-associated protein
MSGGASASFAYDGLGRRRSKTVSATTTKFLYGGLNPVQELSGSTVAANVLAGLRIDEHLMRTDAPGAANYLKDAIGSSVALADGSGTVQTEYTYEPFGKMTLSGASTTSAFAFAGREADAGHVLFYRERYYDAARQRFLAEDPLEFAANLHEYVGNDPVNRIDPLGLRQLPMPRPTPMPRTPWWPWLFGGDEAPQPPPGPYPPPLDCHSKEAQRRCEKARRPCNPCKPPVGTIAFRVDRRGEPHKGVRTPHWHLYLMHQKRTADEQV